MLIFGVEDHGESSRDWRVSLAEAQAELTATKASLKVALDREAALRRRCEALERQMRSWRR
jgi:hypothetical protein